MKNRSNKIYKILHKKNEINVKIKKNKLSQHYKLTFDKKTLSGLVSIPRHITFNDGLTFAKENAEWLNKQFNEINPIINVINGTTILFEGEEKQVNFQFSKSPLVKLKNNNLIIFDSKNNHQKVLYEWIKKNLLEKTKKIIFNFSKILEVDIKKVRLSNSFSYWGSCNSNNEISINWRLILSPSEVLEYIIAHEMCHIVEFNHSKRFWSLVDSLVIDKRTQQNWLKINGNYLYRVRLN